MAEYKHGEMDVSVQERTFHGFVTLVTRAVIVILVILILLAMFNS